MAALRSLYLRRHGEEEIRVELPRRIKDRSNPLEILNPEQVRQRFRFRPEGIVFLVGLLNVDLVRKTRRSNPLPPLLQLLVCLRFLATGSFYCVLGDRMPSVCSATVCRSVWRVVKALLTHLQRFVRFPNNDIIQSVKEKFYGISGFPNVIGVVDGTHIRIQGPSTNENDYVNRKGFHSLNCQMICDAEYRFRNVVAKWPGSVHDSRIFKESLIGQEMQQGVHKGMILGDSGYPCRRYIMVPYLNPLNQNQIRFNKSLCRTRVLIEQSFGILKRRFACLNLLRVKPERACKVVCACVILHNVCVDMKDLGGEIDEINVNVVDDDNVYGGDDREEGKLFREQIAQTYF